MVHFQISGFTPNLVLIVLILINLLEKPERKLGIAAAFLGGFYLDIFSLNLGLFFGFYTLISLLISFSIKYILKKYVQIPAFKKGR
jgi:rod shape-determining protein MreD